MRYVKLDGTNPLKALKVSNKILKSLLKWTGPSAKGCQDGSYAVYALSHVFLAYLCCILPNNIRIITPKNTCRKSFEYRLRVVDII